MPEADPDQVKKPEPQGAHTLALAPVSVSVSPVVGETHASLVTLDPKRDSVPLPGSVADAIDAAMAVAVQTPPDPPPPRPESALPKPEPVKGAEAPPPAPAAPQATTPSRQKPKYQWPSGRPAAEPPPAKRCL